MPFSHTAAQQAVSAAALEAALEGMAALPDADQPYAARTVAEHLVRAYGGEAVNIALKCQDAFMTAGADAAAASMMNVLTAIWDMEDAAA